MNNLQFLVKNKELHHKSGTPSHSALLIKVEFIVISSSQVSYTEIHSSFPVIHKVGNVVNFASQ